ncbi:hypothetical protein OHR68_09080 [Spirillospora sp. NBC_00431]
MRILNSDRRPVDEPDVPQELARELQRQRELAAARRADELERARAEAGHGRARADLATEVRLAELERAEREADVRAETELARMYREFHASGERTRIRSLMARSGEARALRLERLRSRNLVILVPLLIGFGVWSTTGVQQGAARLMSVTTGEPVWWVLWGLEALLIGVVCWIIVVRARLATSGGKLSATAERIAAGCLGTSIFLNLVAAVPADDGPHLSGWAVPGAMFAHAIGPVGAALVAHLIGVIDRSITDADPWHDETGQAVPRLAEMDLRRHANARTVSAPERVTDCAERDALAETIVPVTVWPVPLGNRPALPVIARPVRAKTGKAVPKGAVRTGGDRDGRPGAGTPRRPRPNKGVPVPEAAKPAPKTSRDRTDDELREQLAGLLDRGEIEPGVRAVKDALGVGYDRATRIMAALAEEVTGKADNADLGEIARPLTVLAGGAK